VLGDTVEEPRPHVQPVVAPGGKAAGVPGSDRLQVDHGQVLLKGGHTEVFPPEARPSGVGQAEWSGTENMEDLPHAINGDRVLSVLHA
jgi:hypothetical protein